MIDLSVSALARAYAAGTLTPTEIVAHVYAQIERLGREPVWISLVPMEQALDAARALEDSGKRGPLYGVPFGVKDNIDVAGLPTTAACPEFSYVPARSATAVERLVEAGAVVIGKTNLDQFATGLVGTRTPYGVCSSVYDSSYISGGSSSGSAVAVARRDVSFALGTDTAGSGRVPAGFNNLVGIKPSLGLLSTRGVVPACRSLDCVSIFASSVEDGRLILNQCAGFDPEDVFSRRAPKGGSALPQRPRIGVPTDASLEFFGDSEAERLFRDAVAQLQQQQRAELVPVDLLPFRETAELLYQGPWVAERWAAVGDFLSRHPNAGHAVVRSIVESGQRFSAADAFEARYRLAAFRRQTENVWHQIDALVVPTAPSHYKIEEVLKDPVTLNSRLGTYTNFVNLLDLAGLAVPAGFRRNGLPFGITFLAPAFHDQRLLELGQRWLGEHAELEQAPAPGRVWLAVAGAHLSGQPLNGELTQLGARLLATTRTAAEYRLYLLPTEPPKPGLVHAPGEAAHAIEVELWELDDAAFGRFVANVPAPMTIGTTLLADGRKVKGFACEPYALAAAREISHFGGWRAFLRADGRALH